MNLIKLLEQNDHAVNLFAFEASFVGCEIFVADIRLKRPGESINTGKCYYPLCGKEFIRRLIVRVKESMPFREKWGLGYGKVLPEEMIRKLMKLDDKTILIPSPAECGIKGENLYDDAVRFFEGLHLTDQIKIPDYMQAKSRRKRKNHGRRQMG